MENIIIKNIEDTDDGWRVYVVVGNRNYIVDVDKIYWQELTGENNDVKELVEKSFTFLLHHEPKESILPSFNLRVINQYFHDYEVKIKELLIKNTKSPD
ncbi:hypothetical protein ACFL04_01355 [Patescibacteria group bacterium]